MSTITGKIINETGAAAQNVPVLFRFLSNPSVASGAAIYATDKSVNSTTTGQLPDNTVLVAGRWSMTVGVATYYLIVPDDNATYDFVALLDPNQAVGQTLAQPLAVLGLWITQNITTLRAIPNRTANRAAALYSPSDATKVWYRWDGANTGADDGSNTIKPTDTDVGNPGRWVWLSAGLSGGTDPTTAMDAVADMAALLAIAGTANNKVRLVKDNAAPHALWYYVHGDIAGNADGVNVVRASDNLGNWYSRQGI